jgi:chemotaxis protein CheZ
VQRKVFRIEQMVTGRSAAAEPRAPVHERKVMRARDDSGALESLRRDLALIQDTVAHNKRELSRLIGDGKARNMARAAGELGAAVEGMEKATENILKSAEVVDESAKALTATLRDDYKRGLAQDIQDHVVNIYEACNFQDLAGQRIGNVIRTLHAIEEQVAAMIERCGSAGGGTMPVAKRGGGLLNGPRLDGDSGHASQGDIDAMFD